MTSMTAHRPTASALKRIAIGLYWSAGILLAFAAVIIVGAMGWTTTPEALLRAVFIAVAFVLPAIVLYLLVYWLEGIRYNEQFGQYAAGEGSRPRVVETGRVERATSGSFRLG